MDTETLRFLKKLKRKGEILEKEAENQLGYERLIHLIRSDYIKWTFEEESTSINGSGPISKGVALATLGSFALQERKEKMIFSSLPIVISIIALLKSFDSEIIQLCLWLLQSAKK